MKNLLSGSDLRSRSASESKLRPPSVLQRASASGSASGSVFLRTLFMAFVTISFFAVSAWRDAGTRGGADTYAIYLNNKLLVKQSLADPLNLKNLPLTEANRNDKLIIQYTQCHAPAKVGTSRVVSLRNAEGKVVKEWRFKDTGASGMSMIIPVKEVLDLQKNATGALSFFYSADGLPKTQKLAVLEPANKSNT